MSDTVVAGVDLPALQALAAVVPITLETALAAAANTASAAYAVLLTAPAIALAAGQVLLIDFSAGFVNDAALSNEVTYFELQINGVTWRSVAGSSLAGGAPAGVSMTGRVLAGASSSIVGSNVVTARWRRSSSTSRINPATDGQHAALRLIRAAA